MPFLSVSLHPLAISDLPHSRFRFWNLLSPKQGQISALPHFNSLQLPARLTQSVECKFSAILSFSLSLYCRAKTDAAHLRLRSRRPKDP